MCGGAARGAILQTDGAGRRHGGDCMYKQRVVVGWVWQGQKKFTRNRGRRQ